MSGFIAGRPGSGFRGWALFLDFDGTLAEIAEHPDAVAVDPALPPLLSELQAMLDGALALVSGRPISFLDARLAPFHGDAAGLHGTERRVRGTLHSCRPDEFPDLRRCVARLHALYDATPGVIVEDKGCTVAVHWRLAPERESEVRASVAALADALGDGYRVQYGKAVAEILPAASGKGEVIARFLDEAHYRGRRPIFVGDDLTDEDGFRAVNARDGISIRVGAGETVAPRRMPSPTALREWLAACARMRRIDFAEVPAT